MMEDSRGIVRLLVWMAILVIAFTIALAVIG